MKQFTGIFLFLVALFLTACKSTSTKQPPVEVVGQKVSVDGGSYTDVSASELQMMLANLITGHIF